MIQTRAELLRLLAEVGSLYPEMRIGQILSWFAGAARGPRVESVYDAEDDELIAAINEHLSSPRARARAQELQTASAG